MKKLALVGFAFIGLCVLRAEEPRVTYQSRDEPGRHYYSTNLTKSVGEALVSRVTSLENGSNSTSQALLVATTNSLAGASVTVSKKTITYAGVDGSTNSLAVVTNAVLTISLP